MKAIEWTTEKGSTIKMKIITETENLADHNFKNKCFDLEIRINNDVLGPVTLKDGVFMEKFGREINGKLVRRGFVATNGALELNEFYESEIERMVDLEIKAENECQRHTEEMRKAMGE